LWRDLLLVAQAARKTGIEIHSLPVGNLDMQEEIQARFMSEMIDKLMTWAREQEGDKDETRARYVLDVALNRYKNPRG
jgi:hypothetical protein